ncbi:RNA polymerase sigma factor [Chitinophaga sp. sic0106]|uniref:RNA polymerase sigma factor n=1 Tax=Chitinophaga sp. sic0106 TaxID=2854785 RepID=UPI001C4675B1|nr:RNA polymerase sigma factor [Chitinophaga sp. sic0106]MBV7530244.1 RNA polymerase sigma factor [Chitinophaga sp. sic0106]
MEHLVNEKELLRRLSEDDEAAFQELFYHYWDQLYHAAFRLTKSPELATDIAQETFARIWARRAHITDVDNFPAFLFTISRNLIHDHLRNKVFREDNAGYLETYAAYHEATPQHLLENKELQHLLHEAIDSLQPQLKQVFTMARLQGMRHEAIAKALDITPMSSKVYMVRALAALRKYILERGGPLLFCLSVYFLRA